MTGVRISDAVSATASAAPDAVATVLGNLRWTYHDLNARVDALARALLAAGIKKGDRIATLQTPHPEFLVAFLATASIGGIWVGLNPRYRVDELRHVVLDAGPRILLTRTRIEGRRYESDIKTLCKSSPELERVVVFDDDPVPEGATSLQEFLESGAAVTDQDLSASRAACGDRDPCLIVYTSGSTGKSKGAVLSHEGIVDFGRTQNRLWPVSPLRMLNYFPINHVGCVVDVCAPCLIAGGTLVFMEHFDATRSLELMVHERITLWGSVPSVFQMQLSLPAFDLFDVSAVQLIVFEGAAMPRDLIARLLKLGPPLATNYGMTETTSAITCLEPTHDEELLTNTVGGVFPGVEVKLVDLTGALASPGSEGEVWARSHYNLLEYWRQPAATAQALQADGYFRTGDVAIHRADGRYRLVGRLKEMFKSGGYNVYPREIEAAIEAHPNVDMVAVVCIPHPVWNEVGVAFVATRENISPSTIRAWCEERLANYKIPKVIVVEKELPILPIGKVDKVLLRERALHLSRMESPA